MIRPLDIADNLAKVPLVERAQLGDKLTEDGNLKYQHADIREMTQKRLESAQPAHEQEHIQGEGEGKHTAEREHAGRQRRQPERSEDPDEKEMTNLGYKIDVTV